MDVCWGGSPSAPARVSNRANKPVLTFGPIRAAHRIELNTAAAIITAAMIKGQVPPLSEAREIVSTLNRRFPLDPVNRKEFYRVWNWNNGHPECFPKTLRLRIGRFESAISSLHCDPSPQKLNFRMQSLAIPDLPRPSFNVRTLSAYMPVRRIKGRLPDVMRRQRIVVAQSLSPSGISSLKQHSGLQTLNVK